ncbi:hypothetical protein [Psychrobacter phage vB_PmaS_Y8A]|nr:hypothetical protein [Psychrobacter phage vB_PmaS_Y8A]
MASAKDIVIKPIKSHAARAIIQKFHYSGKTTQNSQLHFGVFINGKLEGALQFGPPIDRRKLLPLVDGSKWGDMIELNRMAFGPELPRNSESRAIAICFKIMRKHYPQLKWVVSFADGTQCGDGTIYRASGFVLTAINKNSTMYQTPDGEVVADKTFNNSPTRIYKGYKVQDCEKLKGFQLRYVYFLDKDARKRLTVPEIPFSEIEKAGAGMYKGEKR